MAVPARRERPMFAEFMDWLEGELPAMPIMRPFTGGQPMRVEDYVSAGEYVVRAELPGIDPEKDVEITVDDGAQAHRDREGMSAGGGESRVRPPTRGCRRHMVSVFSSALFALILGVATRSAIWAVTATGP
jgi:HSP20 family protein